MAYVPESARALLTRFDERSQHYEIRAQEETPLRPRHLPQQQASSPVPASPIHRARHVGRDLALAGAKESASAAVTLTTTAIGRRSRAALSSRTTRSGGTTSSPRRAMIGTSPGRRPEPAKPPAVVPRRVLEHPDVDIAHRRRLAPQQCHPRGTGPNGPPPANALCRTPASGAVRRLAHRRACQVGEDQRAAERANAGAQQLRLAAEALQPARTPRPRSRCVSGSARRSDRPRPARP